MAYPLRLAEDPDSPLACCRHGPDRPTPSPNDSSDPAFPSRRIVEVERHALRGGEPDRCAAGLSAERRRKTAKGLARRFV